VGDYASCQGEEGILCECAERRGTGLQYTQEGIAIDRHMERFSPPCYIYHVMFRIKRRVVEGAAIYSRLLDRHGKTE
jgi:hypothetical protein